MYLGLLIKSSRNFFILLNLILQMKITRRRSKYDCITFKFFLQRRIHNYSSLIELEILILIIIIFKDNINKDDLRK